MPIDISSAKSSISDLLASNEMRAATPYLLSGGGGALLAALLTGRRRAESGEGRLGHLGRILTNAMMAGGLTAGGHYLLNEGIDQTVGSADKDNILSGASKKDEGPLTTSIKNVSFSPVTAGLAGAGGLALTHNMPVLGANTGGRDSALKALSRLTKVDKDILRNYTPQQGAGLDIHNKMLRQKAGIPSSSLLGVGGTGESKIKGLLSSLSRKGALSTFGQSWPRRAGRGTVGLTAAGIPALLGAFMTNESQ